MKFLALYEGERAWIGATELYSALGKLGIDYRLYELPSHYPDGRYVLKAEELNIYTESILNDLKGKPHTEQYEYVKQRCEALKRWAEKGYIVHVL